MLCNDAYVVSIKNESNEMKAMLKSGHGCDTDIFCASDSALRRSLH